MNQTNVLPVSQVLPVKPRTHEQRNLLMRSLHVPPFKHGELQHSSISEIRHVKHHYLNGSNQQDIFNEITHATYTNIQAKKTKKTNMTIFPTLQYDESLQLNSCHDMDVILTATTMSA